MPWPPGRAAAVPFCDRLPSLWLALLLTSSSISSVRRPFLDQPLLLCVSDSISNASTELLGDALARPDLEVTRGLVGVSRACARHLPCTGTNR